MRIATAHCVGLLCVGLLALGGCHSVPEETHPAAPAHVENPRPEAALTTIELTPEAIARLGIETATIERRALPRRRLVGGEVVVPVSTAGAGQRVDVVAPPVDRVRAPEAMVAAAEAAEAARAHVEAAATAARRAERLFADGAGSARAVDEANLQLALAKAAVKSAEARYAMAAKAALGSTDVVWIRVPVYVGDLPAIAVDASVQIGSLGRATQVSTRDARPVAAPPSASADLATADLYYELDNRDHALRPGEKVGVALPLRTEQETLTVPWAAVLHDVSGGEWVYERISPVRFTRHRIQVRYVENGHAALASGPAAGVAVVVAGAAELFGTEFGIGK